MTANERYSVIINSCYNKCLFQILLPVASLLQMTEVRVACSDFLKQQLDPSNCLGIRRFADVHSCTDLLTGADTYTEQHFSEIVHGEEFLNLPAMQICELVSSDQLTVSSEEKVIDKAHLVCNSTKV